MTHLKRRKAGIWATAALSTVLAISVIYGAPDAATTGGGDTGGAPSGGMSAGNFARLPFELSATVSTGYDDNVTTGSGAAQQSSVFSTIGLQLAYDAGSPRTQMSLQAGVSGTYYWDHPTGVGSGADQDYDININFGLSIVHRASPRLTLTTNLSGAYLTEPEFADRISNVNRNGNFFYTQDRFNVGYLWTTRFQTVTSYRLFALEYDESSIGLFEDRFDNTLGNEFRFIWTPETSLVAEYRLGLVNYAHEGDVLQLVPFFDSNFQLHFYPRLLDRDSVSHFVLAGFDHSFTPRLSTSVRGGAEFRDYTDSVPHRVENAPYIEADLNYAAGKQTTFTWSNHYGLEEPDLITNPVRTAYRLGLQANHSFTPKIRASAGLYYTHSDYHDEPDRLIVGLFGPATVPGSPGFSEDTLDLTGQISYNVTRYCTLNLGYTHTTNDSGHFYDNPFPPFQRVYDRDYYRNRVYGGLNYSF